MSGGGIRDGAVEAGAEAPVEDRCKRCKSSPCTCPREFEHFILGDGWFREHLLGEYCMHKDDEGAFDCESPLDFFRGSDEGACEEHAEGMGAIVRKAVVSPGAVQSDAAALGAQLTARRAAAHALRLEVLGCIPCKDAGLVCEEHAARWDALLSPTRPAPATPVPSAAAPLADGTGDSRPGCIGQCGGAGKCLRCTAAALLTQDNECTANPLFLVEQRHRVYGFDTAYSDDKVAWVDSEGEATGEERDALEAKYQETGDEPEGWHRTGYADEWRFVQPFFTRAAAERYIEENRHRLKDPRVFVDSAYRNKEWQAVETHLRGLIAGPVGDPGDPKAAARPCRPKRHPEEPITLLREALATTESHKLPPYEAIERYLRSLGCNGKYCDDGACQWCTGSVEFVSAGSAS